VTDLRDAERYLRRRLDGFEPEAAVVLGSGLGFMADMCEEPVAVPYGDVPGFPVSTAPGHAGRLVFGVLGTRRVAVMQGRFHYYEGYDAGKIVCGVRVLRMLGAETLLVTNACGAVNKAYAPGDIMLIADHINLTGISPLRGANDPVLGPRFPDMSNTYTPPLRQAAREAASRLGMELREGVYMYFAGPQYETPAEIRAAAALGADAVGMSTVAEVVAARHAGMRVLGLSLVCNMAAGVLGAEAGALRELSEQEVLDTAEASKQRFSQLLLACLEVI
jgi:purine-nucleoside phosphorylase